MPNYYLLFLKTLKKRQNGGDGNLQNAVYHLLKGLDKPIDIYFINDEIKPIDEKYIPGYRFYIKKASEGPGYLLFPGTYKPDTDSSSQSSPMLFGTSYI